MNESLLVGFSRDNVDVAFTLERTHHISYSWGVNSSWHSNHQRFGYHQSPRFLYPSNVRDCAFHCHSLARSDNRVWIIRRISFLCSRLRSNTDRTKGNSIWSCSELTQMMKSDCSHVKTLTLPWRVQTMKWTRPSLESCYSTLGFVCKSALFSFRFEFCLCLQSYGGVRNSLPVTIKMNKMVFVL